MKPPVYRLFVTLLLLIARFTAAQDSEVLKQWHFLFEELRIQKLQWQLSREFQPQNIAITHVNLITMHDDKVVPDGTVLVKDGRITAAGPGAKTPVPKGYVVIDGEGRFLMPGLTDMHVHNLVSSSQHLLHLANGITTVRDMDGFPWMLEMRKQIASNRLLGPNMYITGTILNANPMDWYATVIKSAEEGRRIVKEQKAAGYDFIKIHNNMPEPVYNAILQEAKAQQIDAVGHIPHQLTVGEAIEVGQRTLEHFKGYILDRSLTLTSENYVGATQNAEVWNCPTFYNYRSHVRGEAARKLVMESTEMKYASWRDKQDWLRLAAKTDEQGLAMQRNILVMSKKIFKDLIPIGAKFITGTDSGGGYPFMVPGFALQEELRMFQENGLSPFESLKSATVNAAQAMRKNKEFGTIEIGKRADLLMLGANPLQNVANAAAIEAVVVRGIWMPRSELDRILREMEAIYNPSEESRELRMPSKDEIANLLKEQERMREQGFVFRDQDVRMQEKLLGH